MAAFQAAYPDVTLDITVDDRTPDIVAGRYNAGITLDRRIERQFASHRGQG
jgi:DNA-binding transcriptional LysR family regulator